MTNLEENTGDRKKDAYYFSHDADAAMDPKIIALVAVYDDAGYGKFWRLVEFLRTQDGYRFDISKKFSGASLAHILRLSLEQSDKFVKDLIQEFELIGTDGTFIWSDSLCRRMQSWDDTKRKMSERGRKGAATTNAKKSAQANSSDGTSENNARLSDGTSEKKSGYKKKEIRSKRIEENTSAHADPEFEAFWNLYDYKKDKPRAQKLWRKLTAEERQQIARHVPEYVKSTPDKQFRKYPATYLNNRSFENEIVKAQKNGTSQHNTQDNRSQKNGTHIAAPGSQKGAGTWELVGRLDAHIGVDA